MESVTKSVMGWGGVERGWDVVGTLPKFGGAGVAPKPAAFTQEVRDGVLRAAGVRGRAFSAAMKGLAPEVSTEASRDTERKTGPEKRRKEQRDY